MKLQLKIFSENYGVCQLPREEKIPIWAEGDFISITRTDEELSIVCKEKYIPKDIKCEKDWVCIKVMGPLDFSLTGILSSLAKPLAEAKISIFAISTFNTDYLLIKRNNFKKSIEILSKEGNSFL